MGVAERRASDAHHTRLNAFFASPCVGKKRTSDNGRDVGRRRCNAHTLCRKLCALPPPLSSLFSTPPRARSGSGAEWSQGKLVVKSGLF